MKKKKVSVNLVLRTTGTYAIRRLVNAVSVSVPTFFKLYKHDPIVGSILTKEEAEYLCANPRIEVSIVG